MYCLELVLILTEILEYTETSITLDRKAGRYLVNFNGQVFEQRVCEFLYTFSILKASDIEKHLLNISSEYDTIKVPLSICGKSLILSLEDFLILRESYMNEMYLLKLEDMLLRNGIVFPARS